MTREQRAELRRLLDETHVVLPLEIVPAAADLPDRINGIVDAGGVYKVVETDCGIYEPDLPTACLLVGAVNALPDLLDTLDTLREALEACRDFIPGWEVQNPLRLKIEAALASTGGK